MIQIANPIYDVVFKYMMNDEKVAKLLLSAIIGKEVLLLEFRPTERLLSLSEELLVLRMDFSARILDEHGEQQLVLLELQKAKFATDIMRFRRYLGEQYANKDNVVKEPERESVYRKALPILSIYFLGHTLEHIKAPVLRVNRVYTDAATGELIREKEEFVESLTHDSIIIQIPYLRGRRRTELEQLLALFDQKYRAQDPHFLHVEEEDFPERYRPIIRRLQQAVADPVLRQTMESEDDLVEELKDYQRLIADRDKRLADREREIAARDQEIADRERIIAAREQEIAEQDRMIAAREQEIAEQRLQLINAITQLHASGVSKAALASMFNLPVEQIEEILKA